MTKHVLSRRAEADLDEIWDYSAQRWGKEQANKYVEALRRAVGRVAANPDRGRAFVAGRKSYQRYRSGSHLVFYRVTNRGIRIVRILHEGMHYERHLR